MNLEQTIAWNGALAFVCVATIVSNSITLIVFSRREFKRKQSYYLPMNLAVTDLLVGTIALPLYMYLINFPLMLPKIMLRAYQTVDITVGLASLSSIALIALERLHAIGWPLQHRVLERKHYLTSLSFTWLYGFVIMVILVYIPHEKGKKNLAIQAYVVLFSIGTPLVVTIAAYALLFILKRKSQRNFNLQGNAVAHRDTKLAGTLLIVTIVFFLTWTPFAILNFALLHSHTYDTPLQAPPNALEITKLLQYSNSFANFIIYTLRSPSFLAAFRSIFKRGRVRRELSTFAICGSQHSLNDLELQARGLGCSTETIASLA